jgi:hypothetical protein
MTTPKKRTLLIKNVFGALLLNTSKAGIEFSLDYEEDRWIITVPAIHAELADHVHAQLTELNLFYFEEDTENQSIQKWWIYDKNCPIYSFDSTDGVLTLIMDSRVSYSNEHV